MDFIYSELDSLILSEEPDLDYSKLIFYGVSDEYPNSILPSFQYTYMTSLDYDFGIVRQYVTSGTGQYEVLAYPTRFGELRVIDQNSIGINLISVWHRDIIQYKDVEYYLYHTELVQYSDDSTLVFKFN